MSRLSTDVLRGRRGYQVVEFGASHLLAATNVGGYENTGRDLVANLIGTAFAGWLVSRRSGGSGAPRLAPSP